MDAIAELKQDVAEGRIDVDRLVDLVGTMQRQLQACANKLQAASSELQTTQSELQTAQQRIAELEKQLGAKAAKIDEPFSLREEEKRQEKRGKKKPKRTRKGRRGRCRSADKIKRAERTEKMFPEGVSPSDCKLSHTRPVWRLEQGRAVLIAYEIYRGPGRRYGKIPGVLGRCEFGLEFVIELAHLVWSFIELF